MSLTIPLSSFAKNPDRLFYDAVRSEASGDFVSRDSFLRKGCSNQPLRKPPRQLGESLFQNGRLRSLHLKLSQSSFSRSIQSRFFSQLGFCPKSQELKPTTNWPMAIFGSGSHFFWAIFTPTIFWCGLLVFAFLFFRRWVFVRFPWLAILWIATCVFSIWAMKTSPGQPISAGSRDHRSCRYDKGSKPIR